MPPSVFHRKYAFDMFKIQKGDSIFVETGHNFPLQQLIGQA